MLDCTGRQVSREIGRGWQHFSWLAGARCRNGVLTVRLPKAQGSGPTYLQVH